jgi:hypothetical protein
MELKKNLDFLSRPYFPDLNPDEHLNNFMKAMA